MTETIAELLDRLLGLDREIGDVGTVQMTVRAVIVYIFSLVVLRLGSKRLMGKGTAFDIILAIIIGSVLSRAINSAAPFFPTLVAGAVLVAAHWVFAWLAYHTDWFGPLIKGNAIRLIEDGVVDEEALRDSNLTQQDIAEALRLEGHEPDPSKVRLAYLERDGSISVVGNDEE